MYVAAKFLNAGYKIAYAANAFVYHFYNYSVLLDFRRYLDIGVFHAHESWIRQELATAESEVLKFVKSELKYLARHSFWHMPESGLRIICRYIGYRMGLADRYISL